MVEYAFPSLGGPSYNTGFCGASPHTAGYGASYYTAPTYTQSNGMTLRDYFAAAALIGHLARYGRTPSFAAKEAYAFADAMMEAR